MVHTPERQKPFTEIRSDEHLYNIELEQSVIGVILDNPPVIEALRGLNPEIFSDSRLRKIFECAINLHADGKQPDMMTLAIELIASDKNIHWQGILAPIAADLRICTREVVKQWTDKLENLRIKRVAKKSAELALYMAASPSVSGQQLIKEMQFNIQPTSQNNEDDRLKLDVLAYATESNLFRKKQLKGQICSQYRISAKDLEELAAETTQTCKAPKAKVFTGAEFLKLETEGLQWLIPGIVPGRGVTIVAGGAGVGKTTLTYDMGASVLYGDEFLGEAPTKLGKVLFVSSDELACFAQDKLINRGYQFNDQWKFVTDWDVTQKADLESHLEDFKPSLVIVDSFAAIHRDGAFDENSSQAKATVYWLEHLSNQYQCAIALIHHTNKDKEQKGIGRLRGSSAIAAACSAVLILSGEGDVKSLAAVKNRGAAKFTLAITLDDAHYKVVEESEENIEAKRIGDRILALLESKYSDKRVETTIIHNEIGGKIESVRKALDRLVMRQLLAKGVSTRDNRSRVYRLATSPSKKPEYGYKDKGVLSPPPASVTVSCNFDETLTEQEIQIHDTNTRQIQDTFEKTTNFDGCLVSSNVEPESNSSKLQDTIPDGGGERVSDDECLSNSDVVGDTLGFSVKDKVALADPSKEAYNWHGRIVRFERKYGSDGVIVYWRERANNPEKLVNKQPTLWHKLSDLRKL